jgi:hypothetical protein
MVLDALTRAAASNRAGLPLFTPRVGCGLFAPTPAGRSAARRCREDGLLRVVRREPRGKASLDVCDLTDKGLAYLLDCDDLHRAVCAQLAAWHEAGALDDCPLPELYRRVASQFPALSIGQFHDRLRLLHGGGRIYLHPWTGPLYELPEPAYALLIGHEIGYYASLRAVNGAAVPSGAAYSHED